MRAKQIAASLVLLVALVAAGRPARAAQPAGAAPGREAFVRRYVEAVNARDVEALKRLVHPSSLECITPESADVFEDVFRRRLRHTIPPTYRVTVRPIEATEPLLFDGAVGYPVRPTHFLQVDFQRGERSSTTLVIQAAAEGAAWLEVIPCPTAETIKRARQARGEADRQRGEARRLAADMQAPLREALRRLVAEGRQVEAMRRYSAESGADLALARAVIRELTDSRPAR